MVAFMNQNSSFVDNTFDMLGKTMGARTLAFYRVDDDLNLHDFHCLGVPPEFFRLYMEEMHHLDPLHVRRVGTRADRVVRMDQALDYMPTFEVSEYQRFLRRYNFVDNIDILFRLDGKIKAGLSVIWNEGDRRPAGHVFQLAADLQPYMEFVLWNQDDNAVKADPVAQSMEAFHFTPREGEVAKLLCAGCTNADIAQCLGIGVATVKTHLLKIFEKANAETRAGVVARLATLS